MDRASSPLVSLGPELWAAETLLPFPGGVKLPARMTVVRLPDGLLLHSPIRIDDALAAALAALGPVRHVVAPNRLHHLFLVPCLARYPTARRWGPAGLEEKRPDVELDEVLGESAPDAFGPDLQILPVRGAPKLNEAVLFHRPSATLITADLVFNVRKPATPGTHLALAIMGTRGRLAQSRYWHVYARDKGAVRASVAEILALPFRRVVMGHGDVFESERAPAVLRESMWIMRGA